MSGVGKLLVVLIAVCCSVSCVNVENERLPVGGPKLIKAPKVEQFTGRYSTRPVGGGSHYTDDLVYLFAGVRGSGAKTASLRVDAGRLFFEWEGADGVRVRKEVSSKVRNGSISVRRFGYAGVDPLARGATTARFFVYVAEDGSLVGLTRGAGVGLMLHVIPTVGAGSSWSRWERR